MKYADSFTLKITEYKSYLILTCNETPKLKKIGLGVLLNATLNSDIEISPEAYLILTQNVKKNLNKSQPVLEIINSKKIWWYSNSNLIIPPNEILHIHQLPIYTSCINSVDEKIKQAIDGKPV